MPGSLRFQKVVPKFLQGLVGVKDPMAAKRVSHEPLMDIDSIAGASSSGGGKIRPSQDEELPMVANLDVRLLDRDASSTMLNHLAAPSLSAGL